MVEPLISEGLLGVIVGSLLGFGGSYLSMRSQLGHDAEQRDIERKMQLRREVFIEAAQGVAGAGELFLRLANLNVPVTQLGERTDTRPAWLNKMYVVASPRTIEAFSAANLRLGSATFDLLRQRLQLENIEQRLSETAREEEALLAIRQRLEASAADILAQPTTPDAVQRAEEVNQRWNAIAAQQSQLRASHADLWDRRMRLLRNLLDAAVRELGIAQQLVRVALLAMRSELGFTSEDEAILTTATAVDREMGARFSSLLDEIDADLRDDDGARMTGTSGAD